MTGSVQASACSRASLAASLSPDMGVPFGDEGHDSFPVPGWARTARAPTPDRLAGQQVEVNRLAGEGLPGGHLAAL